MPAKPVDTSRILAFIAACEDEKQLGTLIVNARRQGATDVEQAAFRRLIALNPIDASQSAVDRELWQTIKAFEHLLSTERGRTTRLSRTRQKLGRDSAHDTLAQWALAKKETEGFAMLIARGLPQLTGEAIVLRHAGEFEPAVVEAARTRLEKAGVDVAALPAADF